MNLCSIFKIILLSSAMGSILALVIMVVRQLFKNKFDPKWKYYVWFLLITRLMMPYGIKSQLSLFNIVPVNIHNSGIQQSLKLSTNNNLYNMKPDRNVSVKKSTQKYAALDEKQYQTNSYIDILSKAWISGAVLIGLYILIINLKFLIRVNKQHICEDEELNAILAECKDSMKVSRYIPIVYDTCVKSPSIYGFISPKILISKELVNKLSYNDKKYILMHELAHLKHKDILINWIILIQQAINWFNPIIWIAFNQMKQDMEEACDVCVLSRLNPAEQRNYDRTIINLLSVFMNYQWVPGSAGIISHKSNMEKIKRRIIMIKNYKKSSLKWTIISVLIFALIGIFGLTNSAAGKGTLNKTVNSKAQEVQNSAEYIKIVRNFLPSAYKIVNPVDSNKKDGILLIDLDNDGQDEIITAYKPEKETEKTGILVLKKVNSYWVKALDNLDDGSQIDKVLPLDIDGDGKDEFLLGRKAGSLACELSLYKWNGNSLVKMLHDSIDYSKLDIIKRSDKNVPELALWSHDTGEAYFIDIVSWDGSKFAAAEDADYFKEKVVPYYQQMVKQSPETGFYWYHLADSQIKAGEKQEAKKSISKGASLNTGYPSKDEYQKLLEKTNN